VPHHGFVVNHMLETALTAFTTFFAVIGPIDSAVLVASLTPNATKSERRAISLKAVAIATLIVLAFALFGQPLLNQLGYRCQRCRLPAASSS
jgi:multiple antibiotic resistance protein